MGRRDRRTRTLRSWPNGIFPQLQHINHLGYWNMCPADYNPPVEQAS